jgi:hypothetical protein
MDEEKPEPRGILYLLFSAFAFLFGWSLAKIGRPIQETNTCNSQGELDRKPVENGRQIVTIESYPRPTITDEEKSHRKRKEFREWAILVVEVFGLLGLFYYACTTARMWKEMQEQTRIQRSAQRPWLGISGQIRIVNGPSWRFSNPNFTNLLLEGTYSVKNHGTSPAFGANTWTNVVIQNDTVKRPSKDLWGLCPDRDAELGIGELVYPGTEFVGGFSVQTAFDKASHPELARIWLLGCISYQDGDHHLHHTRFWLRSTHPDNSQWIEERTNPPFRHMPITGFESWGEEAD